jgi:2-polyprenyl-3-methyl-5-hydroxy-6-metoxy-1,4-benzoquinol methylase
MDLVGMTDRFDKAGKAYWNQVWSDSRLPRAFNPREADFRHHVSKRFHDYFVKVFSGEDHNGQSLLEIGAARSKWLPYFAKEFGFSVTGIDYSNAGCEQARAILDQAGVSGNIILSDFFAPPVELLDAFDVVVSFGVVEHFENTAATIESLAKFLKPGGTIITVIPNVTGLLGQIENHLCPSIFEVHKLLDRESLCAANEAAGLLVASCEYFLVGGFSIINLSCWKERFFYKAIRLLPMGLSLPFWQLDRKGSPFRPNRITSPYIVCLARKNR